MSSLALAVARSRRLPARVLGIGALVALGWWAVPQLAAAQLPDSLGWRTDFSKASVALDEIQSGGPPKDGIPPIDRPRFDDVATAGGWLDRLEPVIVVGVGDDVRAYPLQVLTWHEIVNDTVGGTPVAVTFCPLCNASIVFDRRLDGRLLDFGTTGKLRMSDLVMYDRQTETWWQQFTGEAIVGELTGAVLTRVPASIVAFEDFAAAHPAGKVLNRDTGHRRSYGRNPYRGYDSIEDRPFLFHDPVDPRLPPMERVLNVSVAGRHRLYPLSALRGKPVLNDRVGDLDVVVLSRDDSRSVLDADAIAASRLVPAANAFGRKVGNRVLTFEHRGDAIVDRETGSRWSRLGTALEGPLAGTSLPAVPSGVHFAFAWLAFNPSSEIYGR
ncbi:MAG: DUF3179 domain-containing protein [Ectothiorhodospiraceae bacterium]|nr:DUF3179 domain-containing protein [Chromatiales bacterium]MCP5156754.1 DUF3179 domain-containing protein [Ectothiorhodospiraceae bacterium]